MKARLPRWRLRFQAKVLLPMFTILVAVVGFMFWLVAQWVDGFHVDSFWAAIGGALLYSVISWALSTLLLKNADGNS